jgi:hypothetical protein
MYELVPDPNAVQKVEMTVNGTPIEAMDIVQLKLAAVSLGVPLGAKRITRKELQGLVQRRLDAVEVVEDDDEVALDVEE